MVADLRTPIGPACAIGTRRINPAIARSSPGRRGTRAAITGPFHSPGSVGPSTSGSRSRRGRSALARSGAERASFLRGFLGLSSRSRRSRFGRSGFASPSPAAGA
jgi:hypothetical protein